MDCNDIQSCSGRNINKTTSPIITEEEDEETPEILLVQFEETLVQSEDNSPPISPRISPQVEKKKPPPYPEGLIINKLVPQSKFDLLGELQNVCVNIPLFQDIKDIPIYSKVGRELCLKKLGRKRKDPAIVHVIGDLAELMMGNTLAAKYYDPGSPAVKVQSMAFLSLIH